MAVIDELTKLETHIPHPRLTQDARSSLPLRYRCLPNWELGIGNLYYMDYVKNSYPLPITHYQKFVV
jgi:hypothetical protein